MSVETALGRRHGLRTFGLPLTQADNMTVNNVSLFTALVMMDGVSFSAVTGPATVNATLLPIPPGAHGVMANGGLIAAAGCHLAHAACMRRTF